MGDKGWKIAQAWGLWSVTTSPPMEDTPQGRALDNSLSPLLRGHLPPPGGREPGRCSLSLPSFVSGWGPAWLGLRGRGGPRAPGAQGLPRAFPRDPAPGRVGQGAGAGRSSGSPGLLRRSTGLAKAVRPREP